MTNEAKQFPQEEIAVGFALAAANLSEENIAC